MQNRVCTRRAAILAYLGQMLLPTAQAVDLELNSEDEQIIFDLRRPKCD